MICPRHNAIATHQEYGRGYCARCFAEAIQYATLEASERVIRGLQAAYRAQGKR